MDRPDPADSPWHVDAAVPQPAPRPGQTDVLPLVVRDLQARAAVGLAKYGTPLQTYNGRDALCDALQEVYDLAMYLRQAVEERGYPLGAKVRYKPRHTYQECDAEGYDPAPWRIVTRTTTEMLDMLRPVRVYALVRWKIDPYSWQEARPITSVDPEQLQPWPEEKPDGTTD